MGIPPGVEAAAEAEALGVPEDLRAAFAADAPPGVEAEAEALGVLEDLKAAFAADVPPGAEAEAEALGVSEDMRAAFAELFAALSEAAGGKAPSRRRLSTWKEELEEARALATVRAFASAHQEPLAEAARELAAGGRGGEEPALRGLRQRLAFVAVYGTGAPLEDALAQVLRESRARLELPPARELAGGSGGFRLSPGVFGDRHMRLRARAYPYTPACGSRHGSDVLECRLADSEEIVGFMAMRDSYADDLSVDPRFQGRGVAKALACGVARQLLRRGRRFMALDVRACNLPAIGLCRSLGFAVEQRHYPCFYDWHGGYSMKAATEDVAALLPADVDASPLD